MVELHAEVLHLLDQVVVVLFACYDIAVASALYFVVEDGTFGLQSLKELLIELGGQSLYQRGQVFQPGAGLHLSQDIAFYFFHLEIDGLEEILDL